MVRLIKKRLFWSLIVISVFVTGGVSGRVGIDYLIKENFNNLKNWRTARFPGIKNYSKFKIIKDGKKSVLECSSMSSASGIIFKKEFSIYDNPILKWRWKVLNLIKKGNLKTKDGDDLALRIYLLFKFDSQQASTFEKIKQKAFKRLYGEYLPHSSLNYTWANKIYKDRILSSIYSDNSKILIMNSGKEKLGEWVSHRVNIIEDYKRAFGENPPEYGTLAIMADSDNTGESTRAFVDYIYVGRLK